jgi:hypothetical protein
VVRFKLRATRAERLLLHVALKEGQKVLPVQGSPYTIHVMPSTCAASRSEAFGDALKIAPLKAPASFVILARDSHGNRLRTGGEQARRDRHSRT